MVLALAQVGQVTGTVRADSTLIPLPNVAVRMVDLPHVAVTDRRGNFVMPAVPPGRWSLEAWTIGYDTARAEVSVGTGGTATVDFLLGTSPLVLSGINVEAFRIPSVGPAAVRVDIETLSQVPALAEVDVLRALEVLPSIATSSEYSTALYVRGATPDQTTSFSMGSPSSTPITWAGSTPLSIPTRSRRSRCSRERCPQRSGVASPAR
jgi:hypothetical protein